MANLSGSMGEGNDSGFGSSFINTGYGTYSGAGNVETGASNEKGTGYDEHGQVKTSFGKWHIDYDPVSEQAREGVQEGYGFPFGMGLEAVISGAASGNDSGGLTDVSMPAAGHSTMAETKKETEGKVEEEGSHQ